MTAGIDEGIHLIIPVARDEDRLTADIGREIVVLIRDLALVRQINPVALEDVLHLEFEEFWICEDVPTDTVDAPRRVIRHRRVERLSDCVEHRITSSDRCVAFAESTPRSAVPTPYLHSIDSPKSARFLLIPSSRGW